MMAKQLRTSKSELDKRFEEFLDEPLSDDSLDTERVKEILQQDDNRPWWMTDEEPEKQNTGSNKFLKSQKIDLTNLGLTDLVKNGQLQSQNESISSEESTPKILSPENGEIIMAFDQLEPASKDVESKSREIFEDPDKIDKLAVAAEDHQTMGQDTLEEANIKEQFFKEIEEQASSTIDYSELNMQLDLVKSLEYVSQEEPPENSITANSVSSGQYSDDFESDAVAENGPTDMPSVPAKDPVQSLSAAILDSLDPNSTIQTDSLGYGENTSNLKEIVQDTSENRIDSDHSQLSFVEHEKKIQNAEKSLLSPNVLSDTLINVAQTPELVDLAEKAALEKSKISNQRLEDTLENISELKALSLLDAPNITVSESFDTDTSQEFDDLEVIVPLSPETEATQALKLTEKTDMKNKTFTVDNDGNFRWHQVEELLEMASLLEKKLPKSFNDEFDFESGKPLHLKSPKMRKILHSRSSKKSRSWKNENETATQQTPSKKKFQRTPEQQHQSVVPLTISGTKMQALKFDEKSNKTKYAHIKSTGYGRLSGSYENLPKPETKKEKSSDTGVKSVKPLSKKLKKSEPSDVKQDNSNVGEIVSQRIQQHMQDFMEFLHGYVDENKKTPEMSQENFSSLPSDQASKILCEELKEWQLRWEEERKLNSKLYADMVCQEQKFDQQSQEIKRKHEQEIFQLQQKNFLLTVKLPDEDKEKSPDKTEDDKQQLHEKFLQEQEKLLHGYQKENEKLYNQLKLLQADSDRVQSKLLRENQRLEVDVSSLKSQLEKKESDFNRRMSVDNLPNPSQVISVDRISELETEIGLAKIREEQLQISLKELKQAKSDEQKFDNLTCQNGSHSSQLWQSQNIKELNEKHSHEIRELQNRLHCCIEIHQLYNKNAEELKAKEALIEKLNQELQHANSELKKKSQEIQQSIKERNDDVKRLQDFERQIKEMESIIRRRYPNSIPALIFAANVDGEVSDKQMVEYLEQQVKKLEKELETKDEDTKQSLKEMGQHFTVAKEQYEQQIQGLESHLLLNSLPNRKTKSEIITRVSSDLGHPHTNVTALEKELDNVRDKYNKEVSLLRTEVEAMKKEIGLSKDVIKSLTLKLTNRDQDLKTAQSSCIILHKENEHLSAERLQLMQRLMDLKKSKSKSDISDNKKIEQSTKSTQKTSNAENMLEISVNKEEQIKQIMEENKQLIKRLEDSSLDLIEQRITLTAQAAKAEAELRKFQESFEEKLSEVNSLHQRELISLRTEQRNQETSIHMIELNRKCGVQEIKLQHLKERVVKLLPLEDELALSKKREFVLESQLDQLLKDLRMAKESQLPEMKQFNFMQRKIDQLEKRLTQKEADLHYYLVPNSEKHHYQKEITDLREKLQNKNRLIDEFQSELDCILDGLQELHQRGITVPVNYARQTF